MGRTSVTRLAGAAAVVVVGAFLGPQASASPPSGEISAEDLEVVSSDDVQITAPDTGELITVHRTVMVPRSDDSRGCRIERVRDYHRR